MAAGHLILFVKELQGNHSCPALRPCTFNEAAQHSFVPEREHITSGYSNQSFPFSSLLLMVQRWALQHLPRGLHSYTRHLNSLPYIIPDFSLLMAVACLCIRHSSYARIFAAVQRSKTTLVQENKVYIAQVEKTCPIKTWLPGSLQGKYQL